MAFKIYKVWHKNSSIITLCSKENIKPEEVLGGLLWMLVNSVKDKEESLKMIKRLNFLTFVMEVDSVNSFDPIGEIFSCNSSTITPVDKKFVILNEVMDGLIIKLEEGESFN